MGEGYVVGGGERELGDDVEEGMDAGKMISLAFDLGEDVTV